MGMTLQSYIGKQSKAAWQAALKNSQQGLRRQLRSDRVPMAHLNHDDEGGTGLRHALGVVSGAETDEQRQIMDDLCRLASWNGYESPPETGELSDIEFGSAWRGIAGLRRAIGVSTPKLDSLAKAEAKSLLKGELSPAFLDQHGNIESYAISYVVEHLFPEVSDDELSAVPDKATHLARMIARAVELLGGM